MQTAYIGKLLSDKLNIYNIKYIEIPLMLYTLFNAANKIILFYTLFYTVNRILGIAMMWFVKTLRLSKPALQVNDITGSAKFATHILTWFSNKNEEN